MNKDIETMYMIRTAIGKMECFIHAEKAIVDIGTDLVLHENGFCCHDFENDVLETYRNILSKRNE